jgi:hypothetical protein
MATRYADALIQVAEIVGRNVPGTWGTTATANRLPTKANIVHLRGFDVVQTNPKFARQ